MTVDVAEKLISFYTSNTGAEDFVPFEYEEPGVGMQTFGEIHLIRAGGSGDGTLLAGIWRLQESTTSPVYTSAAGDETFLVLEGEVTIQVLDTDETFHFKPGDIGSWSKGTRTIWDFKAPFKKFVVVAHDQPMPG